MAADQVAAAQVVVVQEAQVASDQDTLDILGMAVAPEVWVVVAVAVAPEV